MDSHDHATRIGKLNIAPHKGMSETPTSPRRKPGARILRITWIPASAKMTSDEDIGQPIVWTFTQY